MTAKRFTRKEYAIYEKGNPICMTLRDVDVRLNELNEENEQLRELLENGLEVSQVEIDEELERMNNRSQKNE